MSTEQTETWQVEANGQVIDTNFAEMTALIDQGELLRIDRVRKGNLRWIEAGKVPSLVAVFNAKDGDQPLPPVITLTKLGPTTMPADAPSSPPYAVGGPTGNTGKSFVPERGVASAAADGVVLPSRPTEHQADEPTCSMHPDAPAAYVCTTCFSNFCKACPNSYGGNVKICPYCGAMCDPLARAETRKAQDVTYSSAVGGGFGFGDFIDALAYPFKFKASLILGAVMYAFFSVGTGAMGFGGIFAMGGALGCYMLANTLTFGVLSHTVENFAQGKVGENFMPSFDDFSVWDDVIHPFFLSIGVWIASFGPLIALVIVAFFFMAGTVTKQMNPLQSDAARTVMPELPAAANGVQQGQSIKDMLAKQQESQKTRIEQMEKSEDESYEPQLMPDNKPRSIAPEAEEYDRKQKLAAASQQNSSPNTAAPVVDDTEASVMRANESIKQMQQAQAEAIVGKSPETRANERSQMIATILGYGAVFLLLGGLCLLWGLFYFPAACAVAGYTQSFAATLNPTVGLDTIKRLGGTYAKILLMTLAIGVMSFVISGVLGLIFSAFDLPGLGNIPARVIGSLFGFYFSVVFSCIIGFALFKASDRLKLPS